MSENHTEADRELLRRAKDAYAFVRRYRSWVLTGQKQEELPLGDFDLLVDLATAINKVEEGK